LNGLLSEVVKVCKQRRARRGLCESRRSPYPIYGVREGKLDRLTRQTFLDIIQVLDLISELLGIIDQVGSLGKFISSSGWRSDTATFSQTRPLLPYHDHGRPTQLTELFELVPGQKQPVPSLPSGPKEGEPSVDLGKG
jgi:hypothetical protein